MNGPERKPVLLVEAVGPGGAAAPGVERLTLAQAQAQARAAMGPEAAAAAPRLAARLRAAGADAVLVRGARELGGRRLHWLDSAHARGWIAEAGEAAGDGFASRWSEMLSRGHVPADAALLAFGPLPSLSWGEDVPAPVPPPSPRGVPLDMGIYAIVDSAQQLRQVLAAGVRAVQLRIKQPADADAAWHGGLRTAIGDSVKAARDHGAWLVVNDHWRLAAELGAPALHLGQEDLLALGDTGRAQLRATGLALGISSHAAWELCRALALAPGYVACGPVWPTTTKDMPWRPQGLDNLAWWCRTAHCPVVAIGGILTAEQVRETARAGAQGVCVLRGLGPDPARVVPALQEAFEQGRRQRGDAIVPALPHPTLDAGA
ncbi:MAG TPA: thiamine phosphate synthase [Ramlibacter sp.]|jgi:thiamine-phosphate diphosphorylase|uniref:thiamine phosphate synthase n=1 Tax=Ramlibacter sp. TaxID=1917967 RepID=UPI002D4418BE|nr:thiamine phosphate synthase [Ramlibacter sp.]HZY18331.1 thiamine phosphate synthase [Ramlibacter sp.]